MRSPDVHSLFLLGRKSHVTIIGAMFERPSPPWSVAAVAAVSAFEIVAAAVLMAVEVVGDPSGLRSSAGIFIFWVIAGAIILTASWQLARARPWARTVLATWHIIALLSFISLIRALGVWSVLGAVASGAALVLLLTPSTRAYIVDHRSDVLDD